MEQKNVHSMVEQTAKFCEIIFNSQEFQSLFTGDFKVDEDIYKLVGGAVMRYINATKNFDVDIIYQVFEKIKHSDILNKVESNSFFTNCFERNFFNQFFAPEILKKIKADNSNVVDGIADLLTNFENNYVVTNSFNSYYLDQVKSEGIDYSRGDPFEKEYEVLSILGKTGFGTKGIYFADPSKTTMHFCNYSPEKLYEGPLKTYKPVQRKLNEDLEHFLWRKYEQKLSERFTSGESEDWKNYLKNQVSIYQATKTLIDAYKNEQAGIAFVLYRDMRKLKDKQELPECDITRLRNYYIERISEELGINQNVQNKDEIFNKFITMGININLCGCGFGACIENGKVPTEMLAVAKVPQCGLLSLNKQKTMNKIQDDTEMIM